MKKILLLASLALSQIASAQGTGGPGVKFDNPIEASSVQGLLRVVLDGLLELGLAVLTLYIVYAGFKYITAKGDSKAVGEATGMLKWAVIGGAVLLGAKLIATILENTIRTIK